MSERMVREEKENHIEVDLPWDIESQMDEENESEKERDNYSEIEETVKVKYSGGRQWERDIGRDRQQYGRDGDSEIDKAIDSQEMEKEDC